jgi:CBS domain
MFPLQGSGLGGGDIYDNGAHHRVASHREPRTRQQGSRRPSTLAQEVAKRFQVAGHSAYPVVDSDDGHLVGIITRSLLLRDDDWSSVTPIQDVASTTWSRSPPTTVLPMRSRKWSKSKSNTSQSSTGAAWSGSAPEPTSCERAKHNGRTNNPNPAGDDETGQAFLDRQT